MSRFFYILYNPAAGAHTAASKLALVEKALKAKQLDYTVTTSQYAGHMVQLARQIGSFKDRKDGVILVVGGDGTLNQAITGLRLTSSQMPVAYVPAGSGNDFARGIGQARDAQGAIDQILAATEPLMLDVGRYHEASRDESGYFVNNIGVGFDAAIVSATNRSRVKKWLNRIHLGTLAYMVNLIGVFFSRRPFPVAVYVDGKRELIHRAFLVTTTNHPYFGGGVRILPGANPSDGLLDLIVVEHLNTPFFIFLMVQLVLGRHLRYKQVHHYRSATIELQTNSLEFGQMDGEELGSRPYDLQFSVVKQAFWIKLPDPK